MVTKHATAFYLWLLEVFVTAILEFIIQTWASPYLQPMIKAFLTYTILFLLLSGLVMVLYILFANWLEDKIKNAIAAAVGENNKWIEDRFANIHKTQADGFGLIDKYFTDLESRLTTLNNTFQGQQIQISIVASQTGYRIHNRVWITSEGTIKMGTAKPMSWAEYVTIEIKEVRKWLQQKHPDLTNHEIEDILKAVYQQNYINQ